MFLRKNKKKISIALIYQWHKEDSGHADTAQIQAKSLPFLQQNAFCFLQTGNAFVVVWRYNSPAYNILVISNHV